MAVPMGAGAGLLALIFLVVIDSATEAIWSDIEPEAFSGEVYWIAILGAGGFVVGWMRRLLAIPEHVSGAIEAISEADVDHRLAPKTVAVSVVSLISGVALGPTFGLVTLGGGLASLLAARARTSTDERSVWILTGESAGLGGALTSPILAAILGVEIGPNRPPGFDNRAVPALLAATISFAIVVPVLGRVFLDIYELPTYEFQAADILAGAVFGVLGAIIAIVTGLLIQAAARIGAALRSRPVVRATGGGVVLGMIAVALPFTMFSGSTQLAELIEQGTDLDSGLVFATAIGKMAALAVSLATGFIGGNVFPMVFIGGAMGVFVHLLFPSVPYAMAVSCLMAAVPGAAVRAPIGLTIFAALSVGLVPANAAPVAVAVVISYALASLVRTRRQAAAKRAAGASEGPTAHT
jgi:H+/Cl- antiporter ClcA